ncbi:hypothetical protein [Xanthomonas axonopodis]|uniref:Alcohol dehydrogenase n=1 Tax=Xanthomonas cannabis TaxID=1885674 RepID=A0ABR6JNX1_9XANT|nr:hypothetical protein [Xanthomonas cannabis]
MKAAVWQIGDGVLEFAGVAQTRIDCWTEIPAVAPCHDAVVTQAIPIAVQG